MPGRDTGTVRRQTKVVKMKNKLQQYVGRIVRLKKASFKKLAEKAARSGEILENCFLVGAVNRGMRQLICYGGNMRIAVPVSEIVLV